MLILTLQLSFALFKMQKIKYPTLQVLGKMPMLAPDQQFLCLQMQGCDKLCLQIFSNAYDLEFTFKLGVFWLLKVGSVSSNKCLLLMIYILFTYAFLAVFRIPLCPYVKPCIVVSFLYYHDANLLGIGIYNCHAMVYTKLLGNSITSS